MGSNSTEADTGYISTSLVRNRGGDRMCGATYFEAVGPRDSAGARHSVGRVRGPIPYDRVWWNYVRSPEQPADTASAAGSVCNCLDRRIRRQGMARQSDGNQRSVVGHFRGLRFALRASGMELSTNDPREARHEAIQEC